MNIDLSNPIIRFLVGGSNLADGCSVIRNVLLRSLLMLGTGAVCLVVLAVVLIILVGLGLFLWAPWYGVFDVNLSLSYLGNSWLADMVRCGAMFGIVLGALGSIVGALFAVKWGLERCSGRVADLAGAVGNKIADTSAVKAMKFLGNAAYDVAHQICPKVYLQLGGDIERILNDPSVRIKLPDSYTRAFTMRVVKVKPTEGHIRVDVESVDDSRHTDTFFYHIKNKTFSETVVIVDDDAAVDSDKK